MTAHEFFVITATTGSLDSQRWWIVCVVFDSDHARRIRDQLQAEAETFNQRRRAHDQRRSFAHQAIIPSSFMTLTDAQRTARRDIDIRHKEALDQLKLEMMDKQFPYSPTSMNDLPNYKVVQTFDDPSVGRVVNAFDWSGQI
jgi:hypothetical protein